MTSSDSVRSSQLDSVIRIFYRGKQDISDLTHQYLISLYLLYLLDQLCFFYLTLEIQSSGTDVNSKLTH